MAYLSADKSVDRSCCFIMNENVETYLIPNNFIDEGRVFNGAIRTRYLLEAIVMFLIVALPCWILIPKTVEAKFGIVLGCSLPLAMFALVGINGDSFSGFLKNAWRWRKERQIMLFNDHARTYQARPVDVMLSEVYASDVLINSLTKWRAQRAQQNANIGNLVENVDFVFKEDDEYEKMLPQNTREKRKQQQKEAKRAQKNAKKKKTENKSLALPDAKAENKEPKLEQKRISESESQPSPKQEEMLEKIVEEAPQEEKFTFVDEPLLDENVIEPVFVDAENTNIIPETTPNSFVFFEEDSVSEEDIILSFTETNSSIDEPLMLEDIVAPEETISETKPVESEEKTPATVPSESLKRRKKHRKSKGGVSK